MSDDNTEDDKQYEASQHKLDEARKKGDFPRSSDLNTASAYAGLLIAGVSVGAVSLQHVGSGLAALIDHGDTFATAVFEGGGAPMMGGMILSVGAGLSVFFLLPAIFVILSIIAQRGFVFAPSKLEMKLSRISPIAQAKNKFGRTGLFEFAKSFAKLVLFSIVMFLFLSGRLSEILGAMTLSSSQVVVALLRMCIDLLAIVLIVATALGFVDYFWQKAEHARKNRMSRKELVDETKNSEGDQAMKQQRRQKGMAIAMNQMLGDVPDADVIIVNPTHYAVALRWDRNGGAAPVCVAKGVDEVAARIREVAQEHAVPVHSDPPTARALFAGVDIGDQISPEHYRAVAAAIRFADRISKLAKR